MKTLELLDHTSSMNSSSKLTKYENSRMSQKSARHSKSPSRKS